MRFREFFEKEGGRVHEVISDELKAKVAALLARRPVQQQPDPQPPVQEPALKVVPSKTLNLQQWLGMGRARLSPEEIADQVMARLVNWTPTLDRPAPSFRDNPSGPFNPELLDLAAVVASEVYGRPIKPVAYVGLTNDPVEQVLLRLGKEHGLVVQPYASNFLIGKPDKVAVAYNARSESEFALALGYPPEGVRRYIAGMGKDGLAPRFANEFYAQKRQQRGRV